MAMSLEASRYATLAGYLFLPAGLFALLRARRRKLPRRRFVSLSDPRLVERDLGVRR